MPVDPEISGLLSIVAAGVPMSQLSPAEARESFRRLAVDFRKPEDVVPVAATEDLTVAGGEGPLAARLYRPEGQGPFPVVALFHGGGFVIGDLETHDNLARAICRGASAIVVSVDYRLAPEHPFPAAAQDAIAATRDLQARLEELGGDGRLAVAGDSAGGNLSAVATQHVPGLAAQFLIYPTVDGAGEYPSRTENGAGYFLDIETMIWFMQQYAPDVEDVRFSPVRAESCAGLPPAVVVTAEYDPLRDEGEAYAAKLEADGVPVVLRRYEGLIHGFTEMGPFCGAAKAGLADAIALFAEVLGTKPATQ